MTRNRGTLVAGLLLLPLFVAVSGTISASAYGAVQSTCPAGDDRAQSLVAELLTSPTLADFRSRYGIAGVDPSSLRVLTDAQDAAACQRLSELVTLGNYGRPVYFTAGGFYFATAAYAPAAGRTPLIQVPVAVLDGTFAMRGVIGM